MTAPFANMTATEAAGFMSTQEHHRMRDVLSRRCDGKHAIDIGCGRGIRVSEHFDSKMYTGVDCSSNLILEARKANPGYEFFVGDFKTIGLGAYDVAILSSILEHQESLEDAITLYSNALDIADTVLVSWHTPPIYTETTIITVKACDLNGPLYQNHYKVGSFEREDVQVEVGRVGQFTLWTASRN